MTKTSLYGCTPTREHQFGDLNSAALRLVQAMTDKIEQAPDVEWTLEDMYQNVTANREEYPTMSISFKLIASRITDKAVTS